MTFQKPAAAVTTAAPPVTGLAALRDMISVRRPDFSRSEHRWIRKFIAPLGMQSDVYGNLHKRIANADGSASQIMWSCHTDTVHRIGGVQSLVWSKDIVCTVDANSNCLGADDTAGAWIMREMIIAGIPGLYVFHRSEECGGRGSDWLADREPELLTGIAAAIAFDRRGASDIITHQGARCCSDTFAGSLAAALQRAGMPGYVASPWGIFTDTANYTGAIGECTNISVGYRGEHTRGELLDTGHLQRLRDAMLALDTSALQFVREPGERDMEDRWSRFAHPYGAADTSGRSDHGASVAWDWMPEDAWDDQEITPRSGAHSGSVTLARLVRNHPDEVADYLDHLGLDASELLDAIMDRGGVVRMR